MSTANMSTNAASTMANSHLKVSATTYDAVQPIIRASSTASSNDPRSVDIKSWAAAIDRMSDSRLDRQRFIVDGQKGDEISTNALGAKLERALGRRMSGQDAVFTRRSPSHSPKISDISEKMEVAAA